MFPFRPRRSLRPVKPRLPRRALLWYLAAAGLVVATGLVVDGSLRRAAEAEASYGQSGPVVVVTRAVEAGEVIEGDDVRAQRWPRALTADGAVTAAPTGRVALVDLRAGELLLRSRVSGSSQAGPSALLGPEQRAVPVPITVPGLPLEPGDRVDVIAGAAVGGGPEGDLPVATGDPDVIATAAGVLRADDETVVLAVDGRVAADIAAAVSQGPVVLALRPPGR